MALPDGSAGKESACNAGDTRDTGLILGSRRPPAEGNGNALQCSCLENPTDREAWQPTIQRSQRVGHNWATKCTIDYYIMQVFNIFHWLQIHFHWESLTSSLLSWIFLPFFFPSSCLSLCERGVLPRIEENDKSHDSDYPPSSVPDMWGISITL